ncbi:MAG: hypothetical protein MUF49_08950 [Oculatellaceae cyanobacterium Prado106]|nr:hypothetical protein [Oculatellaceae cyanobacterium Prado106]
MEAAEVSDEKLQGYQADFIKMYETVTQGLRDTADAIEKEDVPGIQAGVKMIQDGAAPESQLVDDINAYCSGGS